MLVQIISKTVSEKKLENQNERLTEKSQERLLPRVVLELRTCKSNLSLLIVSKVTYLRQEYPWSDPFSLLLLLSPIYLFLFLFNTFFPIRSINILFIFVVMFMNDSKYYKELDPCYKLFQGFLYFFNIIFPWISTLTHISKV